ncbi:PREDICTED: kynurenine 3-monooxygenase [Ceratosolen solmsi marchali]|uniref:Kynurenine 3-monooxygenase n=1 Tax=Ceratosolen solmsi marchali TaxID=326594 RepID=A0AAJ6YMA3_9HYME|nr:PREDICTED: kynurenine 3-monooxygenase [Ceratosolen solmsi marchali]
MGSEVRTLNVAVVGGGLVGALVTCFLAKRGHRVNLYEYRPDIRVENSRGVSIDLALSARGREALRAIDLEDLVINHHGIAMKGRMIHLKDGSLKEIIYDSVNKNCIYSVNRTYLNQILLSAAEKYENVTIFFNHKLLDADLDTGALKFIHMQTDEISNVESDLIIGADGAYSLIRRLMIKKPRFNCNQAYIDHGYVEVSYPIGKDNKYIMSGNHLHIWPRGNFMMIALPNDDYTFTGNLFAPFKTLEALNTPENLLEFFRQEFPDGLRLIGEEKLVKDFFQTSPKTLLSIQCKPYHFGSKALIIGDAAHAMVPFYAQGMNAGFEDVLLLDKLMEIHNDNLEKVLPHFSEIRCDDCYAICDLAMYNYVEMRELVTKKAFIFRKYIDTVLQWLFPKNWIPLYSTVTFSRMRYRDCISNKAWQDKVSLNLTNFDSIALQY